MTGRGKGGMGRGEGGMGRGKGGKGLGKGGAKRHRRYQQDTIQYVHLWSNWSLCPARTTRSSGLCVPGCSECECEVIANDVGE